jgi:NADH-quinone oxidoreductase subunit E
MFSAETLKKFDREVAKYPADQKQSAVMACLAHAQEEKGWLPPELIEAVAGISRHAADGRLRSRFLLQHV